MSALNCVSKTAHEYCDQLYSFTFFFTDINVTASRKRNHRLHARFVSVFVDHCFHYMWWLLKEPFCFYRLYMSSKDRSNSATTSCCCCSEAIASSQSKVITFNGCSWSTFVMKMFTIISISSVHSKPTNDDSCCCCCCCSVAFIRLAHLSRCFCNKCFSGFFRRQVFNCS